MIYYSREFTHRVKSVSMAKFSPEEVTALQAGGNEVCMHNHAIFSSTHNLALNI